ncbi:RHS repeat domain-containing protein, partial [Catenovulum sediminis]
DMLSSGFIHMQGRVYDPVIGRFLSPDPIVQAPYFSQSWNSYSYAWNNPLLYTDPSGYTNENASDGCNSQTEGQTACINQQIERIIEQVNGCLSRANCHLQIIDDTSGSGGALLASQ